ncbi:MAG: tRNA (N(6)-L-threonylcarbamoyladenosine(37)-C(2))-methylthiotransferase MtaB [Clostridiales bacterium]|jgi:threonylcarbamoyladenosine tRNA methylthiotransferase MtaB|nr:tRNA (N(6)-L-threonylcarbamoyladenosine(37)-C(2))-methylthiotransferase MtaB [Clostridiales bacterium]
MRRKFLMIISLVNLGCKVNQYELQSIKAALKKRGHAVIDGLNGRADVYILNTCAVTGEAERKSRQFVSKIKGQNADAKIIIIGCAAEKDGESFQKKGVDFIIGTANKNKAADIAENIDRLDTSYIERRGVEPPFYGRRDSLPTEYESGEFADTDRARQFVKIQDGCDNMCAYCIIPYLRGRSRSRSVADIIGEIRAVRLNEVVLIGINLGAFGKDTGESLKGLIRQIRLERGDLRLRLGSLEASVIDEELLTELKELKNFCPHFHLSLQSGDDGVLKDMNRRYDTRFFAERVSLIRRFFDGAAITADIIAGFPTESAQAHANTLKFARDIGFSDIHIFPYSKRQGTRAAALAAAVPDGEIKNRVAELTRLKLDLKDNYIKAQIGKRLDVLFEEQNGEGLYSGYSQNYVRVYTGDLVAEKEIYAMQITGVYRDGLKAAKI